MNLAALMAIAAGVLGGSGFDVSTVSGGVKAEPLKASKSPARGGQVAVFESEVADLVSRGWSRGSKGPRYPRKTPDWTNARYRRAAVKARNRARHRAACRGKGRS